MHTEFAYLNDIADACEIILDRVAGLTLDDFDDNPILRDSVYYRLLVIGEATRHVTPDTQAKTPEVPWPAIRRMLNILVHDYGAVDIEIAWDVTQNHLRPLLDAVRRVLPPAE